MAKALQHELQQEIKQYLQFNEIRRHVVRCHEMGGCGVSINISKLTVFWCCFHIVEVSTLQVAHVSTCHD